MPGYTTYFTMNKPYYGEQADIAELNENFDVIDEVMHDNRLMIASPFSGEASRAYAVGEIVERLGEMWRCTAPTTGGTWDSTKWEQTNAATELYNNGGGTDVEANPSGTATADLEKLRVGQTIYGLPTDMTGATSQAAGTHGLVPAPSAGDEGKVLYGDGTWKTPQSAPSNLGDLGDVTLTTPSDGQTLTYDNGEWVNKDLPAVTKTAQGNPIEITDGASAPLVKCVSAIQGSQDLHGYDKPWVGGAGKNKLPVTDWFNVGYTAQSGGVIFEVIEEGRIKITGANNSGSPIDFNLSFYALSINPFYLPNGTYTVSINGAVKSKLVTSGYSNNGFPYYEGNGSYTGVISDDTKPFNYVILRVPVDETFNEPEIISIQYESGSTATSYEPYANICPITAYTEGEIEVRGKNLFDKDASDKVTDKYLDWHTGALSNSANWNTSGYIRVNPNHNYVLSGYNNLSPNNCDICFFDKNKQYISGLNQNTLTFTTPNNTVFVRFDYKKADDSTVQLEKGSTATPYEPYTSTTHATTFPNAIYRGSEDVVNGEVTSEWVVVDMSTWTNWSTVTYDGKTIVRRALTDIKVSGHTEDFICSHLSRRDDGASTFINGTMRNFAPNYYNLEIFVDGVTSEAEMNAWTLAQKNNGTPVLFAYRLATPTTSSVTPTNLPVKSLNGYSHIESSTGDMEIEYITSKYSPIIEVVSRQISTVEKLLELIITANREEEMKATQNYTAGVLLIVSGKLYKASSNIANGSTLVINSNVTSTTIAAELAALA